jgi:hypothetical protein
MRRAYRGREKNGSRTFIVRRIRKSESITTWCSTKTRLSSQSCPLAICDCRYRWYGSAPFAECEREMHFCSAYFATLKAPDAVSRLREHSGFWVQFESVSMRRPIADRNTIVCPFGNGQKQIECRGGKLAWHGRGHGSLRIVEESARVMCRQRLAHDGPGGQRCGARRRRSRDRALSRLRESFRARCPRAHDCAPPFQLWHLGPLRFRVRSTRRALRAHRH